MRRRHHDSPVLRARFAAGMMSCETSMAACASSDCRRDDLVWDSVNGRDKSGRRDGRWTGP